MRFKTVRTPCYSYYYALVIVIVKVSYLMIMTFPCHRSGQLHRLMVTCMKVVEVNNRYVSRPKTLSLFVKIQLSYLLRKVSQGLMT